MNLRLAALALAATTLVLSTAANARPWKVAEDAHTLNEASFTSLASIVRITGRTSRVDGNVVIDVEQPSNNPKGEVTVHLGSLDTGIPLRNEHMRGTIEAEKYPTATFKLKSLKAPRLVAQTPVEGTVTGEMTLHGVTREVTAPVSLTYLPETDKNYRPGDWVAASTTFKLKLSDYKIALPKPVLGVKVADELTIQLDGMAKGI